MLHIQQIFSKSISSIPSAAILLLAYPGIAVAGGNLSISPDQETDASQLQLESGSTGDGSSGTKAKTMKAAPLDVTSDESVRNVGLSSVDPNSSVVFEVPVKINTTGQVTQEQLDLNNQFREDNSTSDRVDTTAGYEVGEKIENAMVSCRLHQGQYYGDYHFGNSKWISLDGNGDYDGIVKIGVPITNDEVKRGNGTSFQWDCFLRLVPGDKDSYGNSKSDTMVGTGGAYNQKVSGSIEY